MTDPRRTPDTLTGSAQVPRGGSSCRVPTMETPPFPAAPKGGSTMFHQRGSRAVHGARGGSSIRRLLRNASPLLLIAVAQLGFLLQGAMLGCSFQSVSGNPVDDDKDSPNSY